MPLHFYGLDRSAHKLVSAQPRDVLNETHKMRTMASYGLERFWGEQIRLRDKEPQAARYWAATWTELTSILRQAGINLLPEELANSENHTEIITALWDENTLSSHHRKVAIAVLMALCDNMIWWAQRYKALK